ncbi:pyridoxamine 5'-phosphate oxidase family protein [Roseivirga sp.]|uniref:pyridoxamine 5'-phosphate oxidase family protein n=1 Tax=Roseivirga sp. TaxID=1964215 RepID=UPI003B52D8DA
MSEFIKKPLNKVVRGSKRAQYDKELIYSILDSHFICHVPYLFEGTAIVIPTAYGRKEDSILIHGSLKNRMMLSLLEQETVSLNVTHLDGIVLARSIFHHSVNYRSVNVFGKARVISDDWEKMEALKIITDSVIANRWEEARIPNQKELDSTLVMAIDIEDASAKVREVEAADEVADQGLDIWAGVLELNVQPGRLVTNSDCKEGIPEPQSALNFKFSNNSVKQP